MIIKCKRIENNKNTTLGKATLVEIDFKAVIMTMHLPKTKRCAAFK